MTNGEKMMQVFPNAEVYDAGNVIEVNYHIDGDTWFSTAYDKEWWDMPYIRR